MHHPIRLLSCLLVLALLAPAAPAQTNLLTNPSCEDGPAFSNPPTGWSDLPGDPANDDFQCAAPGDIGCVVGADDGTRVFFENATANVGFSGLEQIVDVGAGAAGRLFNFSARYADCVGDLDKGLIQAFFLDASNNQVGTLFDSGELEPPTSWQTASASGVAPVDTRKIRVVMACSEEDAGNFCDVLFDTFSLSTTPDLPVEIAGFTAVHDGDAVFLTWRTLSETDNAGFEIQQKPLGAAGAAFAAVAFVAGGGTTAEVRHYRHRVSGLAPGRYAFRLRQVDLGGGFAYGPVVELALTAPGGFLLAPAYPNPFNPQTRFTLTLDRAQHVRLDVHDALGRRVATLHDGPLAAGDTHAFIFAAAGLPSGVYTLRALGESFAATRPVTLVR